MTISSRRQADTIRRKFDSESRTWADLYRGQVTRYNQFDVLARREMALELSTKVEQPAVVLDVGCGSGDFLEALISSSSKHGVCLGLDFSREMLARCRSRSAARVPPSRFATADARELPVADDALSEE